MMVVVNACMSDPVQQVREFEADLAAQFARASECKSVRLINLASTNDSRKAGSGAVDKLHWSLGVDFSPGAQKQQWTMMHTPDQNAFTQGEGDPGEIAAKVCAIVRQEGAAPAD
jgi:hypothetical protein